MPLNDLTILAPLQEKAGRLRLKSVNGVQHVFDPVRKKWIVLQPEEMVRQCVILWLTEDLAYPAGKIQVEKSFRHHSKAYRFDLIVYDKQIAPWMLVECKAPEIPVNQQTFDQIARYNSAISAKFLLVSNGGTTLCARLNHDSRSWEFLQTMPVFME